MKKNTTLTLSLLALITLFITGCVTSPQTTSIIDYARLQTDKPDPEIYIMPVEYIAENNNNEPNNSNDHVYVTSSNLRAGEKISKYRVYAYTDEGDKNIRHSSHDIHRVETTAHWNYNLDAEEGKEGDSRTELSGDIKSYEVKALLDAYGQGVLANSQAIGQLAYAIKDLQSLITKERIDDTLDRYDIPNAKNLEAEKPTDTMNNNEESDRESDSSTS